MGREVTLTPYEIREQTIAMNAMHIHDTLSISGVRLDISLKCQVHFLRNAFPWKPSSLKLRDLVFNDFVA